MNEVDELICPTTFGTFRNSGTSEVRRLLLFDCRLDNEGGCEEDYTFEKYKGMKEKPSRNQSFTSKLHHTFKRIYCNKILLALGMPIKLHVPLGVAVSRFDDHCPIEQTVSNMGVENQFHCYNKLKTINTFP